MTSTGLRAQSEERRAKSKMQNAKGTVQTANSPLLKK